MIGAACEEIYLALIVLFPRFKWYLCMKHQSICRIGGILIIFGSIMVFFDGFIRLSPRSSLSLFLLRLEEPGGVILQTEVSFNSVSGFR